MIFDFTNDLLSIVSQFYLLFRYFYLYFYLDYLNSQVKLFTRLSF